MLKNKKIIIGITGSIAAYKSALLIRLLRKEGAVIKVVMTPLAREFITPVTLGTLSKNTVLCDFFRYDDGSWNSHVDMGIWADLMVIAPATANTIAKMAHGICDNLLLTTYLSARCPVMIAPAMDNDMFVHPATVQNILTLRSFGNTIIEPLHGELASGLEGKGRMAEPENIVREMNNFLSNGSNLKKKKILVTAGPTQENIDPVRYISNRSSGKMGFALAEELVQQGATVYLVSGPAGRPPVHPSIKNIAVQTAEEMFNACMHYFPQTHAAILAAAVSDYSPLCPSKKKIKIKEEKSTLELKKNKDIAAHLGTMKKPKQVLAGFALETDNEMNNAIQKMENKNFDFIVLNTINKENPCFDSDNNKVTIIDRKYNIKHFTMKPKNEVARDIVSQLFEILT